MNEKAKDVARAQWLESQIAISRGQLESLQAALGEIATTRRIIEAISQMEKDEMAFVPIGSGMFARALLLKEEKVLADVGAGVVVEKPIESALKLLEQKEKSVRKSIGELSESIRRFESEYARIIEKLRD